MDRHVAAITWQRALKIYWAHTWRYCLVAVAVTILMMFTYGLFSGLLRELIGVAELILRLTLLLALLLYAFAWAMKRALQVQYSDFQVDMVPLAAGSAEEPLGGPTLDGWQAFAVWWATFWRAVLLSVPLNIVDNYLIVGAALPGPATELPRMYAMYAMQLIVGLTVGTWAMRIALKLDYGSWRLQLVSKLV